MRDNDKMQMEIWPFSADPINGDVTFSNRSILLYSTIDEVILSCALYLDSWAEVEMTQECGLKRI